MAKSSGPRGRAPPRPAQRPAVSPPSPAQREGRGLPRETSAAAHRAGVPPTSAASFSAPPGSPDAPKAASLPRTEAALWREAESRLYLPQASGSKRARTPQVKYIIAIL